jgi:hypothetical protein
MISIKNFKINDLFFCIRMTSMEEYMYHPLVGNTDQRVLTLWAGHPPCSTEKREPFTIYLMSLGGLGTYPRVSNSDFRYTLLVKRSEYRFGRIESLTVTERWILSMNLANYLARDNPDKIVLFLTLIQLSSVLFWLCVSVLVTYYVRVF